MSFVYVIRTAMDFWAILLLTEGKGYTQFQGNLFVSIYEIGGLCGSLAAG